MRCAKPWVLTKRFICYLRVCCLFFILNFYISSLSFGRLLARPSVSCTCTWIVWRICTSFFHWVLFSNKFSSIHQSICTISRKTSYFSIRFGISWMGHSASKRKRENIISTKKIAFKLKTRTETIIALLLLSLIKRSTFGLVLIFFSFIFSKSQQKSTGKPLVQE